MNAVELHLDDMWQNNILECYLINRRIPYVKQCTNHCLPTPYLVVDGVPLDNARAIEWAKEQKYGN
jgi:hypothetical protein